MTLKISISGVRGIFQETLTDTVVSDFAKAFTRYLGKGPVIIGMDGRISGHHIKGVVINELCKHSVDVIDIGIAPTPTVQLTVRKKKAAGGIVVTASHNPSHWNGLKFIREDGVFLNEQQAGELIAMYEEISALGNGAEPQDDIPNCIYYKAEEESIVQHVEDVLAVIDRNAIRKKRLKVAIDCCNGAGSAITNLLLKSLGCEVIAINCDTNGPPSRGLEPIPANIGSLCRVVKEFGADIGFAQDPDADRLSIVSDKGTAIGEEFTLALCASYILSKNKGKKNTVVTNLSTSRMIDDVAEKFSAEVIRTKVGEVNVSEKMLSSGAVIGGEGNGGVIYPRIGFGRDSITGVGLMLDLLTSSGKKVSALASELPSYHMIKDKIELNDLGRTESLLEKVKAKFSNAKKVNSQDGLRLDLEDGWLHVRPSNTEPIVRIIAEGKELDRYLRMVEEIKYLA